MPRGHTHEILIYLVWSKAWSLWLQQAPLKILMHSQFFELFDKKFRKISDTFQGSYVLTGHRKRIFNDTQNPNSFLPWIFSYIGSRPASNMAIVDVKMVSGFIPLKPTVKMVGFQ